MMREKKGKVWTRFVWMYKSPNWILSWYNERKGKWGGLGGKHCGWIVVSNTNSGNIRGRAAIICHCHHFSLYCVFTWQERTKFFVFFPLTYSPRRFTTKPSSNEHFGMSLNAWTFEFIYDIYVEWCKTRVLES